MNKIFNELDTRFNEIKNVLEYQTIKEVDALDITEKGQKLWDSAIQNYYKRIEGLKPHLIERLRHQMCSTKNAEQMFLVFLKDSLVARSKDSRPLHPTQLTP